MAFALVLSSAVLYGLALSAPLGWLLAWLALAPLLFASVSTTSRAAFWLGLCFGLAATVSVAWWFPAMLERYFAVSPPFAWLALLAVGVTVDGLPCALFASAVSWAAGRNRLSPLGVGCAWGLCELARSHGPVGNPFGLLGYAAHDTTLAQAADLAGVFGLGALLAAGSAALLGPLTPRIARGRPLAALATTAGVLGAVYAWGGLRLTQRFGDGQPFRVALVQGAVERGLHWDRTQRNDNLERYLSLMQSANESRPELVFWPEFAVDFYLSEETAQRARLLEAVRAGGADLVLGASRYAPGARETRYYNSVYAIDRSGEFLSASYDKQELVPFSESAPLGDWLRPASAVYAPGSGPRLLETRQGRVGAFVCGEALHPGVARGLARAGAEVLANPSNDYWFGSPEAARQQLVAAAFRAIENRRFVVRATATGISAVIDAHGRVTARSQGDGPEVITSPLERSAALTPYQLAGDGGVALLFLIALLWSARPRGGPS